MVDAIYVLMIDEGTGMASRFEVREEVDKVLARGAPGSGMNPDEWGTSHEAQDANAAMLALAEGLPPAVDR